MLDHSITRREFLSRAGRGVVLGAIAPAFACTGRDAVPPTSAAGRPNLLFIMADDLGFADLSLQGRSDYATPMLDALAREGVRLTQAYSAAPVCSPTRVALMTGRYPARLEVGLHEPLTTHPIGLSPSLPTLSRQLKDGGYDTALIGKWHLGTAAEFHPLRHGFDEFYGHLGPAIDYATGLGTENLEHDWYDGMEPVPVDGYATDRLTERAVEYVSRARTRPFFLSLQYNAPHWPWQAPGDPAYPDSLRWARGGSPEVFARMMQSLDDGVGRVMSALRERGLERDTLVIFTSDNGGERFSSMGPFRDGKMTLWEGGIRVAAFARWPGVIPPESSSSQVASTMDWTATMLGAAGVAPDVEFPPDGIDLLPQLRGDAPVARTICWRITQRRNFRAARDGDWKYLVTEDGEEHLFDLAGDPGETTDQRAEMGEIFDVVKSKYAAWESEMLPPAPLEERYR